MKQFKFIALFFTILLTAAVIFSCSGKSANKPLPNGGGDASSEGDSSDSQKVFDPIIVGDVSFTLPHVPQDIPIATTTTTRKRPSTPSTPNPPKPDQPDNPTVPDQPPRDDDPVAPDETPITGKQFNDWFASMTPINVTSAYTAGFTHWDDGAVENLCDGLDGCTTEEWTKLGGGARRGCYVVLQVEPDKEVKAYALVTGNDSKQYERTPTSWRVWATNTDPETAGDSDWTMIDYVYNAGTYDEDFAPFGYTIDEDKAGTYRYYKFEFLYATNGEIAAIQLCELWLLQ